MSVLIRGVEMPKSCDECPLYTCMHNHDNCPFVPVPPHGRLIDADAFEDFIRKDWDKNDHWIADVVYSRPTIIPAEEGET